LLAAFVPEQLYIAQYVTNELLAATLVTAAFYFCLRIANDDRDDPWNYGALGICLGLSLLTKVTALVAVPVLGAVLAGRLYLKGRRLPAEWARTVGVSVAACAVICGWYYIRNLLTFGQAVIGNWDAAGGGQRWWLDPGYAVAGRFFHGGNFFAYPWFGGFNSFVGGLYSTLWGDGLWGGAVKIDFRAPWNYQLMATGYLLALFPTLLILAGAGVLASRNIRQPRAAGLLVLGTAGVMLAAMITMALKVPSYGEAKAFYGLLALMPMCAMLAAGWEQLERAGKWLVPVAAVLLGVWVLTSYGAFWIPRWNPQTQVTNGRIFEDLGRLDDARKWFDQVVARDPQNLDAAKGLAATAFKDKKYDEARQRIGAVIQAAPDDPVAHSHLSSILAAQDQTSDAVTELAKSQALATNRLENFLQYSDLLLKAKNGAFASIISRTALALNPYSAEAHYGLAAVCVNIGRDAEALDHFRVAVQLRPHWAQAEEQLGLSLLGARQSDAALPLLNDAAAQNPNDVTMLFNLGVGLNAVGQSADAIQAYRRALTLNPDYPDALNNLAWLLATDADPQLRNGGDAIQLAGHACDLTRRQRPVFLATLGAGYAETGRFDDAATTTKQAQDLARSAGDSNFVATCGKLLEFYSTDRAYHQPARAR
jgi:tetratricopeptide (TPR) repeat protein